jgi:hypothetical protein
LNVCAPLIEPVAIAVLKYTGTGVVLPSNWADAASCPLATAASTLIVAELVNAVEGSISTIVLVNDVLEAASEPRAHAPVAPADIDVAMVVVVV